MQQYRKHSKNNNSWIERDKATSRTNVWHVRENGKRQSRVAKRQTIDDIALTKHNYFIDLLEKIRAWFFCVCVCRSAYKQTKYICFRQTKIKNKKIYQKK